MLINYERAKPEADFAYREAVEPLQAELRRDTGQFIARSSNEFRGKKPCGFRSELISVS